MKQQQIKEDKIAAGAITEEEWVPEERTWEEIHLPPVQTTLSKFVIAMDTMGQDREFTYDQKVFALNAIYRFR